MGKFCLLLVFLLTANLAAADEYHVSKKGDDTGQGSFSDPFLTISEAVTKAFPGDTITVHEGIYREWINPVRGGVSEDKRILYRAAPGENVEIKGSEIIRGWEKVSGGVWKVNIPETFFDEYNPYRDSIHGDWFIDEGRLHHTGEVFLNNKSLYEAESLEKVFDPVENKTIPDPDGSRYTWYCESTENFISIWANFHQADPNSDLVEITARKTCFYPEKPGIDYLTIRGFRFSQAATQWGAPTAEQVGMIATHWNKGWIIENNIISDSKCSGITLGKDRSTGHNVWSADAGNVNRDGNIHYIEVIFNVLRNNWDKDHVGSHIVRNNTIFNCEQTAICGSMGAVFSTIENNHIYNIYTKRQFSGWEIAGIKFHAPIDVTIRKNRIHHSGRGIWLDWMTQGTRVSGNLLYGNDLEDLFVEVNHGPYVVDNNILLSPVAIRNWSQGGAYLHNLIAGRVGLNTVHDRFTPYFLPHSISMAGLTIIYGGDDRFFNNIFIEPGVMAEISGQPGLAIYDGVKLPVWIQGNVYMNGARPSGMDSGYEYLPDFDPEIRLTEDDGEVFLSMVVNRTVLNHVVTIVSTPDLGKTKISKAAFEQPDGSPIVFDVDFFGRKREDSAVFAGPFTDLRIGENTFRVW